jgi:probable F420-dependent oxidoreductase
MLRSGEGICQVTASDDAYTLGSVGVWSMGLRVNPDPGAIAAAADELEALGYGSLFIPGRAGGDVLAAATSVLERTHSIAVATGVLNIWVHDADEVAARSAEIERTHPGRFWLGLGVSHAALVDRRAPGRYTRPLSAMRHYLDALDAAERPVATRRMLAALGPKMLALAAERTAGAHPYLVPVSHTRLARQILGPLRLLAPEQPVLLETDPGRARARARRYLEPYLSRFPNYANNLKRLGFGSQELQHQSDRLIDAVVAWGDEEAIASRVREHHEAGADHVCIQVITETPAELPLESWRRLAPALRSSR